MLSVQNLSLRLGGRLILDNLHFTAAPGSLCVLMGANGAGKSTLLRTIAGEYPDYSGSIEIGGRSLKAMTVQEQARCRAVLSQQMQLQLPFTVEQVVAMGRFVYGQNDQPIVQYAMELLELQHLSTCNYLTLSGGQQQRVQMARVLAQLLDVPDIEGKQYHGRKMLLLDEPVTGMDILHQQTALHLAARLARQGVLVIAVLHDFQLAAAFAERMVFLHKGSVHTQGDVRQVLTKENIRHCFRVEADVLDHPDYPYPLVVAGNFFTHNNKHHGNNNEIPLDAVPRTKS